MVTAPHTPVSLGVSARTAGPMVGMLAGNPPSDVSSALATALAWGAHAHSPGTGSTRELWEALATVAAHDLGAARTIEPHLDALAILEQAGEASAADGSTWGVFAAEGGDDPLTATEVLDGWLLSGTKPWCSLAGTLSNALVSAHLAGGGRRLFAVSLTGPGVRADEGGWHARGLAEIASGPVRFDAVLARPVGEAGWYLSRPGFAWGGIGVAACWFGGAVGVARTVHAKAARGDAGPFLLMHLGAIDELVESARRALAEAAGLVDGGQATGDAGGLLAARVRATVARAAEEIIDRAGHALGPAPLALDPQHAKRVSDLQLYLRQHHAERDQAGLGAAVAARTESPW
jgi:alkylation response protein AidB-like acyl-CoA dehydrogenase